jgi:putative transposase
MSVRDIEGHVSDLYGVEIKRDTISRVTDAVLEDVAAWRTRPLEAVYSDRVLGLPDGQGPRGPLCALARLLPGDRCHRRRRPRGPRHLVAETEGAKFWLAVLNDLDHRGVQDILVCCVDG